jgi:Mn-dependent DtxR family transcriptional regulator
MYNNEIKLSGIFENGYGIIPKRLMTMDVHNNVKLILAYMLSYSGGGNSCFPSYSRMAEDLKMSKSTISRTVKECIRLGFLHVEKLNVNNPLNHSNKYILDILTMPLQERTDDSTQLSTTDGTTGVLTTVPHEYCNNNINNNNNTNNKDMRQYGDETELNRIDFFIHIWDSVFNDNKVKVMTFKSKLGNERLLDYFTDMSKDEIEQAVRNFKHCIESKEHTYIRMCQPYKFVEKMAEYTDNADPIKNKKDFNNKSSSKNAVDDKIGFGE